MGEQVARVSAEDPRLDGFMAQITSVRDGDANQTHACLSVSPQFHFDCDSITLEADEDPRNWSSARKWGTTAIISLMGFISPLGSAVVVPGSSIMDIEFRLFSRELSLLPVSFFVLGLGVGPFLLAPASELKGRRPIFVISCFIFLLFNIATAVVRNFGALCFLRFLAGAAGSTGPSLGAGSIGDLFAPRERGRAQSLYGLGPLLGPVCGAIAGGWIAQSLHSWRWLLWFMTILSGIIAVVVTLLLHETYAPVLLRKKTQRLAKVHLERMRVVRQAHILPEQERQAFEAHERLVRLTAYPDGQAEEHRSGDREKSSADKRICASPLSFVLRNGQRAVAVLVPGKELRKRTKLALSRPFRLLFFNPICATFSLYMGFIYGIIFIFLTQHPLLFQRRDPADDPPPTRLPTYGWSPGLASLTYLGLGLGFLVAASINVLLQDAIYARLVLTRGRIGWLLFHRTEDIIADMAAMDQNSRQWNDEHRDTMQGDQACFRPQSKTKDLEYQADSVTDASIATPAAAMAAMVSEKKVDLVRPAQDGLGVVSFDARVSMKLGDSRSAISTSEKQSATCCHSSGHDQSVAGAQQAQGAHIIHIPQTPHASIGKGRPEFRLPLCLVGMIILPCGLLVFGWTAHARTHFMLPLVGSFLVGVGSILPFQAILVYLVDTFIPFSASATACAVLVRCILAAVFPLFSQHLFVSLGFGWGSTLLALISVLAIPLPVVLYCKGEALRQRFHFDG